MKHDDVVLEQNEFAPVIPKLMKRNRSMANDLNSSYDHENVSHPKPEDNGSVHHLHDDDDHNFGKQSEGMADSSSRVDHADSHGDYKQQSERP